MDLTPKKICLLKVKTTRISGALAFIPCEQRLLQGRHFPLQGKQSVLQKNQRVLQGDQRVLQTDQRALQGDQMALHAIQRVLQANQRALQGDQMALQALQRVLQLFQKAMPENVLSQSFLFDDIHMPCYSNMLIICRFLEFNFPDIRTFLNELSSIGSIPSYRCIMGLPQNLAPSVINEQAEVIRIKPGCEHRFEGLVVTVIVRCEGVRDIV